MDLEGVDGPAPGTEDNAPGFPRSISDLCASLDLTYTNVLIPCNFCGRTLSSVDCVLFDHAECFLLWKDGFPRAICHYCMKLMARFEYVCFYKRSCSAQGAEQMLKKPLVEFRVRCLVCLRRLQRSEVQDARDKNVTIHVVGYKLRVTCNLCQLGL